MFAKCLTSVNRCGKMKTQQKSLWLNITVEKLLIGEEGLQVIATCGANKKSAQDGEISVDRDCQTIADERSFVVCLRSRSFLL